MNQSADNARPAEPHAADGDDPDWLAQFRDDFLASLEVPEATSALGSADRALN